MNTATPYLVGIIFIAVVLDILFVRAMQKYRRLKKEAIDEGGKLRVSKFELIQQAFWEDDSAESAARQSPIEVIRNQPIVQPIIKADFLLTTKKSLSTTLFAEGLLILFLGVRIYSDLSVENHYKIFWSFAVGVSTVILGIIILKDERAYKKVAHCLQRMGLWLGVSSLQAFLLITSPIFTVLTVNAAGLQAKMWSPYVAIATWLIGIGLAVIGAWKWAERFPPSTKQTILWCVLMTLLAFPVRGIATGTIPILLTGDEASMGINAVHYVQGDWNNIFITGWFSFPTLYYFIQSLGIRIFENPIEALRIPSALAGALTVGAVYLCGKLMFGHRAGIFASLILTSLHLHIHFSRLGLNNIWDGLWFTLTIAMLWYGWKSNSRWAYLLAGLCLGISQYFYASSKALVGVFIFAALLAFVFQRIQFRQEIPNLFVMLLVALVIFIPLGWHYANDPRALLAPFARASMLKEISSSGPSFWKFLSLQLPNSLAAYVYTPFMQSSFWYPPEEPLLHPIAATVFSIGLVFLLFRRPDSRTALLNVWLLFIALGNALSSITPVAQRYVAAAPVCALVAGYGLHKIAETFASLWPALRRIIPIIAYIILGFIVVSDLWFYFIDYTGSSFSRESTSNGMVAHQCGNYLKAQPAGTQVVFFGVPRLSFDSPAILYLASQIKGINAPKEWDTFDQELTSPKIIFVFLPEYRQDIELVKEDYPGGRLIAETAWNGDVLYWVYEKDQ